MDAPKTPVPPPPPPPTPPTPPVVPGHAPAPGHKSIDGDTEFSSPGPPTATASADPAPKGT